MSVEVRPRQLGGAYLYRPGPRMQDAPANSNNKVRTAVGVRGSTPEPPLFWLRSRRVGRGGGGGGVYARRSALHNVRVCELMNKEATP